jgi:alkylation response protein AidB-like acyl-CoA dehydrogenase
VISFAISEDQSIARLAAAGFAETHATPAARQADEASAFPADLVERAWALGLVQAAAGEEAAEQPSVTNAIVIEEIAHGDVTLAAALAAPLGFVRAIAGGGSPAQKRRHLPAFAGDAPRFAAIAHVDAGWLRGLNKATRARRTSSGWRLDGAKACVPLAARCQEFLVTAETDTGARAFIVPASTPGLRIARGQGSLGLRALQSADVVLENVIVTDEEALPGDIRRILDLSRVAISAMLSGLARCVYDYTLPYTKQRVVHGEAIARKQAVAFKLADMHIATQAMRWMTLRAAYELDAGQSATRGASLARRYAAEQGLKIADEGVQLFGGHGFMRDMPLEMWYRNARSLSVLDGLVGV